MSAVLKWKASFNLLNVEPNNLLNVDGFTFDFHKDSTENSPKARVVYRFTTGTNYPKTIVDETKETIERFLAVANVNLAMTGWDVREPVEEFNLELENSEELREAGLNPPVPLYLQTRNTSTYSQTFVDAAWKAYSQLATHNDAPIIFRVLRLLRQSMIEDDEYDRFSKIWRGFNVFYNHLAPNLRASEANRIKNFASRLCSEKSLRPKGGLQVIIDKSWTPLPKPTELTDHLTLTLVLNNWSSIMDCLVKQTFEDNHGNNLSQSLEVAIAAKNIPNALESSLLCLYVERCKVEHGEMISESERNLLYVCASYLQRVVAVALNEFYFIPLATH